MDIKEFYAAVGGNYNEVFSQLGDDEFILDLLKRFIAKNEMEHLKDFIKEKKYQDAFICAHDMKGYGLNMALPELHKAAHEVCEPLRNCKELKIDIMPLVSKLETAYNNIKENVALL